MQTKSILCLALVAIAGAKLLRNGVSPEVTIEEQQNVELSKPQAEELRRETQEEEKLLFGHSEEEVAAKEAKELEEVEADVAKDKSKAETQKRTQGTHDEGNSSWAKSSQDADAWFWRTGEVPRFTELDNSAPLPPKCGVPTGAYAAYPAHIKYCHTPPCPVQGSVSNIKRFNSIRGLLAATKKVLDGAGVPYALYQGTAIGQARCQDVIPWDTDCDVAIWAEDAHKIPQGDVYGPFTVKNVHESPSIPFVVADKSTGFYCDIFFMKRTGNRVGMAWPWSKPCPFMPQGGFPFSPGLKKCHLHDAALVTPFVPCTLNGIQHKCFRNQAAYLKEYYEPSVITTANRSTVPGTFARTVGHTPYHAPKKKTIKNNDFAWVFRDP